MAEIWRNSTFRICRCQRSEIDARSEQSSVVKIGLSTDTKQSRFLNSAGHGFGEIVIEILIGFDQRLGRDTPLRKIIGVWSTGRCFDAGSRSIRSDSIDTGMWCIDAGPIGRCFEVELRRIRRWRQKILSEELHVMLLMYCVFDLLGNWNSIFADLPSIVQWCSYHNPVDYNRTQISKWAPAGLW